VQVKRYVRPCTSRVRSFAVFRGLTNGLLRPAIANERARFPRFLIANIAWPARGRLGSATQARSVIVTRTETGFASAGDGSASAHSALAAANTVGRRSLTWH
jgi:hypothetical protein